MIDGHILVSQTQDLPSYSVWGRYLSVALGFSVEDASWLTGVNIAMGIISTNLAGVLGDWAIRFTGGRRLLVRNICVAISSLGPTICLLLIVGVDPSMRI